MITKEILDQYFDLDIHQDNLTKNGEVKDGDHGITLQNDEYYASQFHLMVDGVAKADMKAILDKHIRDNTSVEDKGKFQLNWLAKPQNKHEWHLWPKVTYSNQPDKPITKIKLSWLVEHFVYSKSGSYARERDIIRSYIGEHAADEFEKTIKTKKGVTSRAKFNAIRFMLEALFNAMNQEKLLPDAFVKPVSFGPILRYFSGEPVKGYQIDRSSKLPEIPHSSLDFLKLLGNKGSHYDEKLIEYTKSHNDKYLVNACVFMLLDLLMWYKDFVDSNPGKQKWTRTKDVKRIQGRVKRILMDGHGYLKPNAHSHTNDVYLSERLIADHQLKEDDIITVNAINEGRNNLTATDIV